MSQHDTDPKPILTLTRRATMVGGLATLASGCFGKFAATTWLYDWNKGVSDNKWLRWLVFLALIILPVYSLFMLADAIVINTIEFFTNDNPISGGHADLGDGHTLQSSRTEDPDVIQHAHYKDGELVRVLYVKRVGEDQMLLLDENYELISRMRIEADGSATLLDPEGNVVHTLDLDAQERAQQAIRAGASITESVDQELVVEGRLA